MESFERGLLVIASLVLLSFLSLCFVNAYNDYLRIQALSTASDPLAAACAYDSGDQTVPAACLVLSTKELPQ